jgi:RNA polymerase sigma-70 factor (ECF subfamily)
LEHLPDEYRTVTILSDIEGYTYEEIGDFLEIPIGTVRSRLHRARKILRSILKEYAMDHGYITDVPEPEMVLVSERDYR